VGKIANVVDVSECTSIQQVLTKSGTDWEPILVRPTYGEFQRVEEDFDPGSFRAIVNPSTKNALGFVKGKYRTQSHTEQLNMLQPSVTNGIFVPQSVSVWDDGAAIAYQFRVTVLEKLREGIGTSPLLTLAFFHDGKGSDMAFFADFRWFCKNQMGMVADITKGLSRARHCSGNRITYQDIMADQVKALEGVVMPRYNQYARMMGNGLTGKPLLSYFGESLGMKEPGKVVDELYAEPQKPKAEAKTLKEVLAAYREDKTEAPNSVWHAFNGVTRYITHNQGRNPATRAARALLGPGQATIGRAFTLASAMAA
jgi:hypothetical protein